MEVIVTCESEVDIVKRFKYLGSVLRENGRIVENLASSIRCGQIKWWETTECCQIKKNIAKSKREIFKTIEVRQRYMDPSVERQIRKNK